MTRADAERVARTEASQTGTAVDIWQHVGGRLPNGQTVLPQGRYLTRAVTDPAPRHAWSKVGTVTPPKPPPGTRKKKGDRLSRAEVLQLRTGKLVTPRARVSGA